ncbi:MAG: chemotaxis protein CheW [Planctomycetes bacterium]|nr:chemotaxis protein CheW [Planctomycetota bacterium]
MTLRDIRSGGGEPDLPGAAPTRVLAGRLAGTLCAVDLASVQEVRPWVPLEAVPEAPPFLLGVLALRGHVVPVLRLGPASPATPQRLVVARRADDAWLGLAFEEIRGIRRVSAGMFRPRPPGGDKLYPRYLAGWIEDGADLLSLIAPERLLADAEEAGMVDWFGPLAERLADRPESRPPGPGRRAP